jgi:hypothetical protein
MNGYGLLAVFALLVCAYVHVLGLCAARGKTRDRQRSYSPLPSDEIVRPKYRPRYDPNAQEFYRLAILHKDGSRGMSRTREQSVSRLIEMAHILKAKPLYAIRVKLKPMIPEQ